MVQPKKFDVQQASHVDNLSCKSGQIVIKEEEKSSAVGQLSNYKIPQHPNTITNMHI